MSLDQSREATGVDAPRVSAERTAGSDGAQEQRPVDGPSPMSDAARRERVDGVLQSDIGISTLLNRLKQSISSARDFASFLKKRATIEDAHAQGLKRLSQGTAEVIRRPENKQGSFAHEYFTITRIHDRMADHGSSFGMDLHKMSDELHDLASNMERGRKHWKQSGLNAENRVSDSESAMEKAKSKYWALADQYDRARTGERQSGRFGLKGPNEDELHRKLETADNDYAQKVHAAQAQRNELLGMLRPQAVKALYDLIAECDSGLSTQMQKFAALNERLLLSNGLSVNPLKSETNGAGPQPRSLREVANGVNNERDFQEHVLSLANKAGTKPADIKYEKHPALASPRQQHQSQFPAQQSFGPGQQQYGHPSQSNTGLGVGYEQGPRPGQMSGVTSYQNRDGQHMQGQYNYPNQQVSGPPPQQSPYGNAPQLPQLDLSSGSSGLNNNRRPENNQRSDLVSPMRSHDDYRSVSSPMHQTRPGMEQAPEGAGSNYFLLRTNQDRSVSQPGIGGGNHQTQNQNGPGGFQNSAPPPANMNDSFRGGLPKTGFSSPEVPSEVSGMTGNGHQGENRNAMSPIESSLSGDRALTSGPKDSYVPNTGRQPQGQNQPYRPEREQTGPNSSVGTRMSGAAPPSAQPRRSDMQRPSLPPLNPVFGVTLDELFRRDGSAVPTIVYQCVQAVDLFGLDTEGVYRTSGSAPHIMEMKALFDNDSNQVDFRNPANFHNDIASVTTLLKHFLRDLPDPLLTGAQYNSFIQAAKLDDDIVRRDSLHAIINSLPDPNYATLRVLTLHLNRVADHSDRNRMTPSNLAICFGPTLMGGGQGSGAGGGGDIRDAGWQARVVETILANALQIFDDDE